MNCRGFKKVYPMLWDRVGNPLTPARAVRADARKVLPAAEMAPHPLHRSGVPPGSKVCFTGAGRVKGPRWARWAVKQGKLRSNLTPTGQGEGDGSQARRRRAGGVPGCGRGGAVGSADGGEGPGAGPRRGRR